MNKLKHLKRCLRPMVTLNHIHQLQVPSASFGIKTECVNMTLGGRVNTNSGAYTRGMGQGNFRL